MDKPTLYIETSIVSYLASRPSRDPVTARNQQLTHAWWNTRRQDYELYTSDVVLDEASAGDADVAARRLALLAPLHLLRVDEAVYDLAEDLQRRVPLPVQAREDAFHIAVSAVHAMAYLLTWNCKHIANPHLRRRIHAVCSGTRFTVPALCTPRELLGG